MSSRKRKEVNEAGNGPAAKRQKPTEQSDPASAQPARRGAAHHAPSVQNIVSDPLTHLSLQYWAPGSEQKKPFDAKIVEQIFQKELDPQKMDLSRIMLLEVGFYLEKYVQFRRPSAQELFFVFLPPPDLFLTLCLPQLFVAQL
jgi:hypothetical protein